MRQRRDLKARHLGDVALRELAFSIMLLILASQAVRAQDLSPRAYTITPLHSNAMNLSYNFYSGAIDFNVAAITDATGTYHVPSFSYYHAFSFFGRSANVTAGMAYGIGNFQGTILGTQQAAYRSGLTDTVVRLSVNLKGGPAMELPQFVKWKQKVLLGVSLRVSAPTGQYSANKLINWGSNRWGFKPEFGYSQRFRDKWVLDGYAGVWFSTSNPALIAYPNPPEPQTLSPIGSFEGHISRDIKPRLWLSLDSNFWYGGTATEGGVTNPKTKQINSRLGATCSFPITKHTSVKASYSGGTYVSYGGNFQTVSVGWQYSWLGRPR